MQFPKNAKIEVACDKEITRYAMGAPRLDLDDPENPVVVACNGVMLVALPVTDTQNDHAGPVPVDALKAGRKLAARRYPYEFSMSLNGSAALKDGQTFERDDTGGRFPRWRDIVSDKPADEDAICFDAHLLADIVKAAGGSGIVTLHMAVKTTRNRRSVDHTQQIRVKVKDSEATCILMPCKID